MRKFAGVVAIVFTIFAAMTRPDDAAVILRAAATTLGEAANALIDVLVGLSK
jgi:hypothetical protein